MQKVAAGLLLVAAVDAFRIKQKSKTGKRVESEVNTVAEANQASISNLWREVRRMADAQPQVILNPRSFTSCHLSESDCNIEDMTGPTLVYPDDDSARCYNGEAFGFFVNPGARNKLYYYFPNGGACWEFPFVLPGSATICLPNMLLGLTVTGFGMGLTDYNSSRNGLSDYTFVSPPYCSGGAHVANTTVRNLFGTRYQNDYSHNKFTIDWAKRNLDQNLESMVLAGSSAGALGTMAWADYMLDHFQYNKASVIVDSYMGVFPEGSQGPTLKNFGVCNLPIFAKFRDACESGTANIQDVFDEAIRAHPKAAFAIVQPKTDIVQRLFYAAISLSYFNLDLYLSSNEFYEITNSQLQRYSRHPNFVNYYVDGFWHTFVWYPLHYTASVSGELGLGGDDGQPKLAEWVNGLVNHEPVQSACKGRSMKNGGEWWWLGGTSYCDSKLYPKTLSVSR